MLFFVQLLDGLTTVKKKQNFDVSFYTETILKATWLPWRLIKSLERWTENTARARYPELYNLLHLGRRGFKVRPITHGPEHHFFGYYDKSPWNKSGKLVLCHEVGFNDRPPREKDKVKIGLIHLNESNRFEPLAETFAWNWQQGAMLQWHPKDPENLFIHNDRREGDFVGIVRDTRGREVKIYNRPIYAATPDGMLGYSLNFSRLHNQRPGYGYAGGVDPWEDAPHPDDDGIYCVDLTSGESCLLISLELLARLNPKPGMRHVFHWVNHIQVSRDGKRFAFFHIWRKDETGWSVRLYTANIDGSELRCLLDSCRVSHYDWQDGRNILVWARHPETGRDNFLLCNDADGTTQVVGERVLTEDGHCSFSPGGTWILNDTYPDTYDMRNLMLYDWQNNRRIDIARLYSPKKRWWGEIRCDLHPRWSRDGRQVSLDSVHNGERQMYVIDVEGIVA